MDTAENKFLKRARVESVMANSSQGISSEVSNRLKPIADLFASIDESVSGYERSTDSIATSCYDLNKTVQDIGVSLSSNTYINDAKSMISGRDKSTDDKVSSLIVAMSDIRVSSSSRKDTISDINDVVDNVESQRRRANEASQSDDIATVVDLLEDDLAATRDKDKISDKTKILGGRAAKLVMGSLNGVGAVLGGVGKAVGGLFSFVPGVGPFLGPMMAFSFGFIGRMLPWVIAIGGALMIAGKLFAGDPMAIFDLLRPAVKVLSDAAFSVLGSISKALWDNTWWVATNVLTVGINLSAITALQLVEYIRVQTPFTTSAYTMDAIMKNTTTRKEYMERTKEWRDANTPDVDDDAKDGLFSGIGAIFNTLVGSKKSTSSKSKSKSKAKYPKQYVDMGDIWKGQAYNDDGSSPSLPTHSYYKSSGNFVPAKREYNQYDGSFSLGRYTKPTTDITTKKQYNIPSYAGTTSGTSIRFYDGSEKTQFYSDNDKSPDTLLLSSSAKGNFTNLDMGPKSDAVAGIILDSYQAILGEEYQPYLTSGRRNVNEIGGSGMHALGHAIDIGTRYANSKMIPKTKIDKIAELLRSKLGGDYDIVAHTVAGSAMHMHLEFDVRRYRKKYPTYPVDKYSSTDGTIKESDMGVLLNQREIAYSLKKSVLYIQDKSIKELSIALAKKHHDMGNTKAEIGKK